MEPKEIAAMLENHCNIGVMLVKSQGKVADWGTKTRAWGYLLGFILDSVDSMDRAHYASEDQYLAFDAALLRTLGTGKTLKDILDNEEDK